MTEPTTPLDAAWEALLQQGLEACFATAAGNRQTPGSIFDFLRVAYLPAIEAAILDSMERESPESRIPYGEPCPICGPSGHERHAEGDYRNGK